MPTMTSMTSTENDNCVSLRQFLDEKRVPYILCSVEVKNGKKSVRGNTIPRGWTTWDYSKTQEYNNTKADPKCEIMNINLNKGGLMVVDIDGDVNVEELVEKYGGRDLTKSINRQLPHIWFERQPDDPYTTIVDLKGDKVDYLYHNVFENKDSIIRNHDGYLDEFDWNEFLGKPKPAEKKKKTTIVENINKTKSKDVTHPLLDIIAPKYWSNYSDWIRLLSAIKNEFENYEEVAVHYSTRVAGYQDAGDDVIEKLNQLEAGQITMGTIHHYAKISDMDAYAKMLIPKIEPDDESIAQLFLNAFGENITKDINGETYVYYRGGWQKQTKDTSCLIKGLISRVTLPIINKALQINNNEIDNATKKEQDKLDGYSKMLTDTRKRIRSANGTDAIFKKMNSLLAMRDTSTIVFDTGKDQYYNINFKNGIYELKTGKFRPRRKEDYVTQILEYNYSDERNEENMQFVESIYHKLQPDQEQHSFMMEWLASHLDGNISREKFKINVGSGGNGKTMEFSIHSKAFSIYSKKFNNEVFNKDFTKQHKEYFDLSYRPIRMAIIEELDKDKKLNIDKMKDFITGKKLPLEIMYGTQRTIDIQATLNICSNSDPNAQSDGGIVRRGLLQRYNSKFVDTITEDDVENHIYVKEEGIDDRFDDDEMKLAYFHVLLKYYNPSMKAPKSIQDAFKETLLEYDSSKQILEKYFIEDKMGRVHKDVVKKIFEGEGMKSWRAILSEMKRMGIEYKRQGRIKGFQGQGVFVGLKQLDMEDEECNDI